MPATLSTTNAVSPNMFSVDAVVAAATGISSIVSGGAALGRLGRLCRRGGARRRVRLTGDVGGLGGLAPSAASALGAPAGGGAASRAGAAVRGRRGRRRVAGCGLRARAGRPAPEQQSDEPPAATLEGAI